MTDKLLHTPDGVRDIYSDECAKKEFVQEGMREVLKLYGFKSIQTPSFEFFDIFNKERGTVPSREMYKFFDREGNTMALRPDITPSIARCVAKYYKEDRMPIRLCYVGNTYINNSSYQGKLKEYTQVGAELINDDSTDADVQMIAITVECLLKAGLREFQIELGHADLFAGLVEQAGMDAEDVMELKVLIADKNIFGASCMMENMDVDDNLKNIILRLPELFGNHEIIDEAKRIISNDKALAALDRLDKIYSILEEYGFSRYISFDLGMLSKYDYYTGIIIKGYTYGTGEPIATGGRYDRLTGQFGKDAPAIGIAIQLDQLMIAMQRQNIEIAISQKARMIVFERESRALALKLSKDLREQGICAETVRKSARHQLEDYKRDAEHKGCDRLYFIRPDGGTDAYDLD